MKKIYLIAAVAAFALGSCTSAYRTGQTPDDVYFSPSPQGAESYVSSDDDRDRRYRSYEYDAPYDRWLRMRVRNPYRWNAFDDYDLFIPNSWTSNWSSPYSYNFNNYWNGYMFWNNFYNPYCTNVVVFNPKQNTSVYKNLRTFNLNSYTNNNYNNGNSNTLGAKSMFRSSMNPQSNGGYNNTNSNTLGNSLKKVFSGSSSAAGGNYYSPSSGERPTRFYSPSSSSGSSGSGVFSNGGSSGGGSRSGGSVVRPGRGGN